MKKVRLLHYLHELTLGGGTVHVLQLLKDTLAAGVPCAVAAFQNGEMKDDYEKAGVDVFVMPGPEHLEPTARSWKANVLHGHTCGGGSDACRVARRLGVVGGETIHSMVPGQNREADFEVVEVEQLRHQRPGATLIPWAFPPERFAVTVSKEELRRQGGIPAGVPIIGRNGRLDGSKRPDEFIRCLSHLPGVWGVMVGDGPARVDLERLAVQLGCRNRLWMPGTRRDTGNWLNLIDIVVYPTQDESVCAGVVEPLVLAKPVICYPVGGMSETILHRKTGLHAFSVRDLVNGVTGLLEHPEVARQLGEQGRRHLEAKGQLDPAGEARQHLALYQRCHQDLTRRREESKIRAKSTVGKE